MTTRDWVGSQHPSGFRGARGRGHGVTRWCRWSAMAALGLPLAMGCAGSAARRGGWPAARVRTLPEDVREAYGFFASRCSRCHTLSRPLSAGIEDPEHWRRYVARMRRMPGAGISGEDAKRILTFLEYHADWVRQRKETGNWFESRFGDESSSEEAP